MQIYIDLIANRLQNQGVLPEFNFERMNSSLKKLENQNGLNALEYLITLLDLQYVVHRLAAESQLPLEDAYANLLMSGAFPDIKHPVTTEQIFQQHLKQPKRPANSAIRALIEIVETSRIKEIADLQNRIIELEKKLESPISE